MYRDLETGGEQLKDKPVWHTSDQIALTRTETDSNQQRGPRFTLGSPDWGGQTFYGKRGEKILWNSSRCDGGFGAAPPRRPLPGTSRLRPTTSPGARNVGPPPSRGDATRRGLLAG